MKSLSHFLSFLQLGAAAIVLASPAERTSSKVVTPFGLRDPVSVQPVPEGAEVRRVGDEIHLLDASGAVLHVTSAPTPKSSVTPTSTNKRFVWGTAAFADWFNYYEDDPSAFSYFNSTFNVPPAPVQDVGQAFLISTSLGLSDESLILGPTLQYGPTAAGGGPYWAITSWYQIEGGGTYYTPLINVTEGDILQTEVTLTSVNGSSYTYVSSFPNFANTTLTVANTTAFGWATEVFTVFYTETISNYPASAIVFSDINLLTADGVPSDMTWQIGFPDYQDGILMTVDTDGPVDGQITLNF